MSEIITYKNTKHQCFCQIKLDSGERILISIAGTSKPSIKIFKLFFGFFPTKTIWEYSPAMAGGYESYLRKCILMFAKEDDPKHPLDAIIEILKPCSSIDEVLRVMLDVERKSRIAYENTSEQDKELAKLTEDIKTMVHIISSYGEVLEKNPIIAAPVSLLPYPKENIKNALRCFIIILRDKRSREVIKKLFPDEYEYLTSDEMRNALEVGYTELAKFVSEKEAAIYIEYQNNMAKAANLKAEDMLQEIENMEQAVNILDMITKEAKTLNDELKKLLNEQV